MPDYRLYLLDSHNGHIIGVEEIHSADDPGAIAQATEHPRGMPTELWCGGRKVCRFDALPDIATYAGRRRRPAAAAVRPVVDLRSEPA